MTATVSGVFFTTPSNVTGVSPRPYTGCVGSTRFPSKHINIIFDEALLVILYVKNNGIFEGIFHGGVIFILVW
jgi:hypothetical protein